MSEAARSVRHYVSDCLSERYPYNPQKGFAGERLQDTGKVFRGFQTVTIDTLLESLSDPAMSSTECAKAVHYLYAYSASQEVKIELVKKGIVALIVSILNQTPILGLLEHQCFLLMKSLCAIPQGCYAVMFGGAFSLALDRATRPTHANDKPAGLDPREAALHTILQIASDFLGVRWSLYPEKNNEFVLAEVEYPCTGVSYAKDVFKVLATVLAEEPMDTQCALYALESLVHMTALEAGTKVCLRDAECVVEVLITRLCTLTVPRVDTPKVTKKYFPFLERLCEVLWNMALLDEGLISLNQCDTPDFLFALFGAVWDDFSAQALPFHRTLSGVISALYNLLELKLDIEPRFLNGLTRVEGLLTYLVSLNQIVAAATESGRNSNLYYVNAAIRNTILALQLAMEAKQQRAVARVFLYKLDQGNMDSSQLREQIFRKTKWAKDFGVLISENAQLA